MKKILFGFSLALVALTVRADLNVFATVPEWGALARQRLNLPEHAVRFLLYHGENDAEHIKEFEEMLGMVLPDPFIAERIVVTAKVTARLYALQIEEIAA